MNASIHIPPYFLKGKILIYLKKCRSIDYMILILSHGITCMEMKTIPNINHRGDHGALAPNRRNKPTVNDPKHNHLTIPPDKTTMNNPKHKPPTDIIQQTHRK